MPVRAMFSPYRGKNNVTIRLCFSRYARNARTFTTCVKQIDINTYPLPIDGRNFLDKQATFLLPQIIR